jgi:hypothetical protein
MQLRRKRRRIEDDVEFLGDSGNSARRTAIANGEATNWPVPSSVRSSLPLIPIWDHTLTVRTYTGLAEMRALLCEPVLLVAGSAVRPVAHVQT